MLHTSIALVQDKPGVFTRVASLFRRILCFSIALSCLTTCARAEQTTIHIRFVNGRSGKPLRLKSYDWGSSKTAGSNYQVKRVDSDSLIVTFNNVSEFAFRSQYFEPCDTQAKGDSQPKYNVHEIMERGVVAPNFCGHAHEQPKPGELVIYSRHEHWWRVTGDIARGLLICA